MTTDFDYRVPELFGPVVFRPSFNNFEPINETQAWSLFFTASREDKILGFNGETGRFFTYSLVALIVASTLADLIF